MNTTTTTPNNLVFITKSTIRNENLLSPSDRFVSYNEGIINKLRIFDERKPPLLVGEYFYYLFNLKEAKEEGLSVVDVLKYLSHPDFGDDGIVSLMEAIKNNEPLYNKIKSYNKIIFISYIITSPKIRGNGYILKEFIKTLNKNHLSDDVLVLAYLIPIQYNNFYNNFVLNGQTVEVWENIKKPPIKVDAKKYYSPETLSKTQDYELDLLKLYSLGKKCGFKNFDNERGLFFYSTKK